MKRSSVTEAKNQLSALLNRVRHGESVLIEDRGVAVAQLIPVAGRSGGPDRDILTRLERQGIVRPPHAPAPSKLALTRPPRPESSVALSRLAIEERGEGW